MHRPARLSSGILAALCLVAAVTFWTAYRAPQAHAVACDQSQTQTTVAAGQFWPQNQLNLVQAHRFSTGAGVLVAVIDSGISRANPQVAAIPLVKPTDVLTLPGYGATDVTDCYGHGTAVSALIAARPVGNGQLISVAPGASIMPIKQDATGDAEAPNQSQSSSGGGEVGDGGTIAGLVTAIDDAVAAHAAVINISLTTADPSGALLAALVRAGQHGVVVVAAAGNGTQSAQQGACSPCYPAAYARTLSNVIAVQAVAQNGSVADSAQSGNYITISAPGLAVPAPSFDGRLYNVSGSSLATPYVSGTVALIKALYPTLTPAQIRNRLIRSAQSPPETVPGAHYGYGYLDPLSALTSVVDDSSSVLPSAIPTPVPVQAAPVRPSRLIAHIALGSALALIALAGAALITMGMLRRPRGDRERSRPEDPHVIGELSARAGAELERYSG